jgi:hypothetical protein
LAEYESPPTRLEIELKIATLDRQERAYANDIEREKKNFAAGLAGLVQAQTEFSAGIADARKELQIALNEIDRTASDGR